MATAAATKAFVARANQRLGASGGRQRTIGQLSVSPFGLGAYRLAEGDVKSPSLEQCLEDGILNVIDTSSSYSDGASECRIGDVLADTLARGTVKREEIVVVTKIGHVPAFHEPPHCVSIARDGAEPGKHSIHPEWLQKQLAVSTARLGTAPDVVLLHNPEFALTDAKRRNVSLEAAHDHFHCGTQVRNLPPPVYMHA